MGRQSNASRASHSSSNASPGASLNAAIPELEDDFDEDLEEEEEEGDEEAGRGRKSSASNGEGGGVQRMLRPASLLLTHATGTKRFAVSPAARSDNPHSPASVEAATPGRVIDNLLGR